MKFWKAKHQPILIFVILLTCLIWLSLTIFFNWQKKRSLDKEIANLKTEVNSLNQKNQEINQLITYLSSDQFVEAQAKLSLGLKRPGEKVVVVKDKNQVNGSTIDNQNTVPTTWRDNGQAWLVYFFGG